MINATIRDGTKKKSAARVTGDNELVVAQGVPVLPNVGEVSRLRYYSALLGSTGGDSGTTNMNVDGSSTAQEFFIAADTDFDIRIMGIVIFLADSSVAHSKFGDLPALSTGFDLKIVESGEETFIIKKAKTGGEIIAQSGLREPYGNDATSFQLSKVTSITDAQTIFVPINDYVPQGLRIGRGTLDRISAVANDNLTGLTEFSVRILGYKHYP